jgi:hypothetical protein
MDYHADRFTDHSLLVLDNGKVVALFPGNEHNAVISSHAGLTYGGLITGKDAHAGDVLAIFDEIGKYYREQQIERVIYKAIPSVFRSYPADEDLYALSRCGATLIRRDLSSVVDMASRPKLSDSRKSTARKAEKAGANFRELADFSEFHVMLCEVLRRFDSKPVHSLEELRLLKNRFPDQIRLFGAVLGEQLIAGAIVYDLGPIVHTQYLASSDEGRKSGALDFVLLKLLEDVFAGKKFFSFGISTEDNGRALNEGLIRQKEGFGGRGIVHDFYEWVL